MDVAFGAEDHRVSSPQELATVLTSFDGRDRFEFWIYAPSGPSMCVLRSGPNAWLMYLRFEGDSGFTSVGDTAAGGLAEFTLSNGQLDEYPLAWCVPLPLAHRAVEQFFLESGTRPSCIAWAET